MDFPQLIFILADPAREENIGAAARALKTMGIDQLFLVNPLAHHLGEKARATAHASHDILENAKVFTTLAEAIQGIDLVIGSSAKKRNVAETYFEVAELPDLIINKGGLKSVAIVFGGEESGLTNEQLALCHIRSTIPMANKYPSLNLAQSVMVYATYLSKLTLWPRSKPKQRKIAEAEFPVIRQKAMQILEDVSMKPDNLIYPRIMERLMLLEKDDINLFHSFAKYYLKKYHGRLK
jgi:tRNA/rRNA methyltransferase